MKDRNDPHTRPHEAIAAAAAERQGITDPATIREIAETSRALSLMRLFRDLARFARGDGLDGFTAFLEQQYPDGEPCPVCDRTHPISRDGVASSLTHLLRLLNRGTLL